MTDAERIVANAGLFFQGRGGLAAALAASGVGAGDHVAVQAFTCVAVPEGVLGAGAAPVYVDVEPGGVNIDAGAFASVAKDVRALVVQHTFGIPVRAEVFDIARSHGVAIVEDCCHTLTSRLGGATVGDGGDAAFTSFEWGKPIVAGLGGAAWSRDPQIHAAIRRRAAALDAPPARVQAKLAAQYAAFKTLYRPGLYWFVRDLQRRAVRRGLSVGNFGSGDLDDWSPDERALGWTMWRPGPALARAGARNLTRRNARAARWAEWYATLPATHVATPSGARIDWARYPLLVDDKQAVLERARAARIEVAGWYETPVHPLRGDALKRAGYESGSCPEAERRCGDLVSLSVLGKPDRRRVERAEKVLRG